MAFEVLKSLALSWATGTLREPRVEAADSKLFDAYEKLNLNDTFLLSVVEELLMNSLEHGLTPIEIFFSKKEATVFFGIWDRGTGIHNTLPRNPKLSDTKDKTSAALVRLSLEEHITGTGQVGRGVGLGLLSKYVKRSDSELLIWSNGAWVMQAKDCYFEQPSSQNVDGTMILLSVAYG